MTQLQCWRLTYDFKLLIQGSIMKELWNTYSLAMCATRRFEFHHLLCLLLSIILYFKVLFSLWFHMCISLVFANCCFLDIALLALTVCLLFYTAPEGRDLMKTVTGPSSRRRHERHGHQIGFTQQLLYLFSFLQLFLQQLPLQQLLLLQLAST